MPRRNRHELEGVAFHVMNRAVRGTMLFLNERDFNSFAAIFRDGFDRYGIKVISYQVMDNHWHFVVICDRIADLSKMMHWAEGKHANNWAGAHRARGRGYGLGQSRRPIRGNEPEARWQAEEMIPGPFTLDVELEEKDIPVFDEVFLAFHPVEPLVAGRRNGAAGDQVVVSHGLGFDEAALEV